MAASDNEKSRLDEAARAGWLYFIAGHTQDEIAKMLQVSRASAQRLVSLCLAERLITFRLEHPIAACMELAARLKDLFHLAYCEVVPTDPAAPLSAAGIAERAANILESTLRTEKPTIVALGTGRAVRAAVERVSRRSTVRTTRSCRWSETSRPTARRASSTPSAVSPTAPRRATIRCRCRF
jgi:DNA-binding transcriptional regulator LsrR (DeoR family)